ncbi:MAG TPA: ferredoxin [Acidimicrobiales bacterium]
MKVAIDGYRSVGSGNCVFWAPATFTLNDDGVSVLMEPVGDDLECIMVAAEGCPTRAISVTGVDAPAAGTRAPRTLEGTDADRTD